MGTQKSILNPNISTPNWVNVLTLIVFLFIILANPVTTNISAQDDSQIGTTIVCADPSDDPDTISTFKIHSSDVINYAVGHFANDTISQGNAVLIRYQDNLHDYSDLPFLNSLLC